MMSVGAKNLLGVVGIAVLVAAAGSVAVWQQLGSRAPVLDGELCRRGEPLAAHTLILVDQTDPLTIEQRRRLRHVIDSEARRLAEHEKLSVLALSAASPYEPEILFARCAPKNVRDVNELTGNPGFARAKWNRDFGAPLDSALDRLMRVPNAPVSPIVEAVKGLTWRHDFGSDLKRRRLVVFSDMLQNTDGWSQYGRGGLGVDFDKFSASAFAAQKSPELRGATVRIAYLERPETLHLQGRSHKDFWLRFFRAAGAEAAFWSEEPPAATLPNT